MKHTRLLIAEDNRIFRECITAILKTQPDMRVVAVTGGDTSALQMAHQLNPHVLLIGPGWKNQNVMQIVKSASRELPEAKVIGMGLLPTEAGTSEFVSAGPSGFVQKGGIRKRFPGTTRAVAKNTKRRRHSSANFPAPLEVEPLSKQGLGGPFNKVRITARELEIIKLIADGLSNKEIARHLNIATYTVKSHVHNILSKLALRTRLQIATYAHSGEFSSRLGELPEKPPRGAHQYAA